MPLVLRRGQKRPRSLQSVPLRRVLAKAGLTLSGAGVIILLIWLRLLPSQKKRITSLTSHKNGRYVPAPVEKSIIDHMQSWGWNSTSSKDMPSGCSMWTDPEHSLYTSLQRFQRELEKYQEIETGFKKPFQGDIRGQLFLQNKQDDTTDDICGRLLRLHSGGLSRLFPSGQLSHYRSASSEKYDYVEPLTPPMRHPKFCINKDREYLLSMHYMVHDFESMCRKLRPHSRTVLIDMGASLKYHDQPADGNSLLKAAENPIVYLLDLYEKFGFTFDHIYGYEYAFTKPEEVYTKLLPSKYIPAFHWINAGVTSERGHRLNPLDAILRTLDEDDFVVVKLDIDTPNIEVPLAYQILEDDTLSSKIDQFYFEHHVFMKEMAPIWRTGMSGALQESFELFHGLRRKGVPAHFWV